MRVIKFRAWAIHTVDNSWQSAFQRYEIVDFRPIGDSHLVIAKRPKGRKFYQGIVSPRGINIGTFSRDTPTWEL